ncbi:RNA polymerase sigma factor [candidate division KSB1 bacterium]|nr:RNA polymerase sigma factor [candidate division KSB1 bacterium]
MQEKELLEKITSGDVHAFKLLFESYRDDVFNLCYRFANNREDAEDLCQEVFFKIYNSAATFKHKSKLSTWIYRITVNLCLNFKRKHHKFNWLFLDDRQEEKSNVSEYLSIPIADQPDSFVEKKEREQIVQDAINSLPKNQRVALILQRYEELSVQEIADILGASALSVQSRLARAKENLCKKILPQLT